MTKLVHYQLMKDNQPCNLAVIEKWILSYDEYNVALTRDELYAALWFLLTKLDLV